MTVILLRQSSDASASPVNTEPQYDRYTIHGAVVRECFAVSPENENSGTTVVYYIDGKSSCTGPGGRITALPRLRYGDMAILYAGTSDEVRLRVAEAAYFTGSRLSHVRIKLK